MITLGHLLPVLLTAVQMQVTNAFVLPSTFKTIQDMWHIHPTTIGENEHNKLQVPFKPIKSSTSKSSSCTELYGIPKMFRWLTDQYPNINSRLNEGLSNDKKVDNFYLDMNGIIHPCTHGNNQDEIVVLDETAMFKKIFGYVDR
jgi:hypothetical protein